MSTIVDRRWRVDVGLGVEGTDWRHEWTIYRGDRVKVGDDTYVLGGLTFGWAITTAYWPAQPVAQTCSLRLNVPAFVDVSDLVEGDLIYVKVRPYATEMSGGVDPVEIDGPVVAEFFGRISDLAGTPRTKRAGVTLAVTAVDYTVDLTEGLNKSLKSLNPFVDATPRVLETTLANIMWTNLGGLPNTIDDLWTSNDNEAARSQLPDDLASALEALLLSAFVYDPAHHASKRMLVSPMVDANGLLVDPDTDRMFTLDTITLPDTDAAPDFTLSGGWVEKGVEWTQSKSQRPGVAIVTATIGETEEENIPGTLPVTIAEGLPTISLASIEVTGWDTDRYTDMAAFYLGDPAQDDPWHLGSVVLHPELVSDDDDLHQLADDLFHVFPHWQLEEEDSDRAAGYLRRVSVEGIEDTWAPYAGDVVLSLNGIVTGVTVKISGRVLTFEMALRRMRHVSIEG